MKNISTFILRITLIHTQLYLYIIKFTFDTYIEQLQYININSLNCINIKEGDR